MKRNTMVLGAALLLAASLAGWSCDGPSEPDPTGPNSIRIIDPAGLLGDHESAIHAILDSTLARVADELQLTGVAITVRPGTGIPGYGLGGNTPNGFTVRIEVDPGYPDLAQRLPERLPPLLAHELHHARRWRGPGYGRTLLEAMVSEGMADRFAIEFLGAKTPPWSDAIPQDETAAYLATSALEFDSATYDHDRWFFGASPDLPRWTGYTLGFRLVETYQAEHPGESAAQLVDTPANAFLP